MVFFDAEGAPHVPICPDPDVAAFYVALTASDELDFAEGHISTRRTCYEGCGLLICPYRPTQTQRPSPDAADNPEK